jgi:hypothetical protein
MRPRGRFVIGTQEPKNFCSATLRLFQGHWPKIIKVFLLLFVHKKKFFLFLLLCKIIFSFVRLGSYQKRSKKTSLKLARLCHTIIATRGASTVPHGREAEQKFFGSFFQKRTSSFLCNAQMTWIGDLHEV